MQSSSHIPRAVRLRRSRVSCRERAAHVPSPTLIRKLIGGEVGLSWSPDSQLVLNALAEVVAPCYGGLDASYGPKSALERKILARVRLDSPAHGPLAHLDRPRGVS